MQTTELTVEGYGQRKTVMFEWESMIAVLPRSYTLLADVGYAIDEHSRILLNLTLHLSANQSLESSILTASGSITNSGDSAFKVIFGDNDWDVGIVRFDGKIAREFPDYTPGCFATQEFEPQTKSVLSNYSWNVTNAKPCICVTTAHIKGYYGGVCNFAAFVIQKSLA